MTKKGISPVISAVLLIAFVIVIFLFVSNWIRGSIVDEATQGTGERLATNMECMAVILDVSDVAIDTAADTVRMNVDNGGDVELSGIQIRVLDEAGNTATVKEPANLDGSFDTLERITDVGTDHDISSGPIGADYTFVEVYPVVNGGLCRDQLKSVGKSVIGKY